jgi:hypothetical protein
LRNIKRKYRKKGEVVVIEDVKRKEIKCPKKYREIVKEEKSSSPSYSFTFF